MNLTPEQNKELAQFPAALRALVEAELAAGNSVVEVGHSHPAPPVGAYFKLANKVTTRVRASGDGLRFYERNSSLYSGEFTDAQRFFFVLEPGNPPPTYPDMDAIRKAHEPKPDSLVQLAQREAWTFVEDGLGKSSADSNKRKSRERKTEPRRETAVEPATAQALTLAETTTGWTRVLHFRDPRPPQEIQFGLERELMVLFVPTMDSGKLTLKAKAALVGAKYCFELRFEAALPLKNCYSLRVEASWGGQAATNHDYYRKTSVSWFELWTRDFQPANPPREDAGSSGRYQKSCEAALKAEQHLDTIPAIQQAILDAMKRGATYSTSHKEGGSNICWRSGCFAKTDYGEYPAQEKFASEEAFLKFLRQFYDRETSKNIYPDKASDLVAWKLILRLLLTK